ncbi:hypothetical protein IYX23_05590 [Methylocystis sp. L43]|uniref:hypothetical protein n=1 Tax=unclassified Methylocystis TaxID=2625913 RepID=UPI0018C27B32|nr:MULTISPECIES: hypothetical protein [unclassified Methylocystis]MBG0797159.1 hypothetical protein [Methylocystis sp. L43]MBG0804970.1 hypothetical protein [Methylocystis sp. H15]
MENPYWTTAGQGHHLDLQDMRVLCFDIHNIVASSSTLIGRLELAEPEELSEDSTLRKLHYEISEPLLSNRLLHLAIMLRTYDDMMSANDSDGAYTAHVQRTSGSDFVGNIDKGTFSLRDACNKIIHASEIRPLYESVYNEHEESTGEPVGWKLTGEIELSGVQNKKPWTAELYVQNFLEVALDRLAFTLTQPLPDASSAQPEEG